MRARPPHSRWSGWLLAAGVLFSACSYDLPDDAQVNLMVVVRGVPAGTRVLEVEVESFVAPTVRKTPPFGAADQEVTVRFADIPEGAISVRVRALGDGGVAVGEEREEFFFGGQRTVRVFDLAVDPECGKDGERCKVRVNDQLRGVVRLWPVPSRNAVLALSDLDSTRTGTLYWVPLTPDAQRVLVARGVPEAGAVAVATDGRVAVVGDVFQGISGKLFLVDEQGNAGAAIASGVAVGTTLDRRQRVVFTRGGQGPLLFLANSQSADRGSLFLRRAGAAESVPLGADALWPAGRDGTVLVYQHGYNTTTQLWRVSRVPLASEGAPEQLGEAKGAADQRVVVASREAETIVRFDETGSVRVLRSGIEGQPFDPGRHLTVSPDGSRAAWLSRGGSNDPWTVVVAEGAGASPLTPPVGQVIAPTNWRSVTMPAFGLSGDGGGTFFLVNNDSSGGELLWRGHDQAEARRLLTVGTRVAELLFSGGSHAFVTASASTRGGTLHGGRDDAPPMSPLPISDSVRPGDFTLTRDGSRVVYVTDRASPNNPGKLNVHTIASGQTKLVSQNVFPGLYDFRSTGEVPGLAYLSGTDQLNGIRRGRLVFFDFRTEASADVIEDGNVSAVALIPGTDKLVYAIADGTYAGVYTAWRIPKVQ